jgi:hypothetical protein
MAISTTTNTVLLAGNGSSVVFPYSFPFYQQTDLKVYLFDTIAGGITQQILNSNYSVAATADSTGIYPNGGNVIFSSSVVNTTIVVIDRQPIETQTFAILQSGFISSVGLTHQLDYLTLLIQDMADRIARTVSMPSGFGLTNTFNPQIPTTVALGCSAGLYLTVNSSATGWTLAGSSTLPTGALGSVFTGNGIGVPATFQQFNVGGSNVMGTLSLGNGGTGGLVPSEWGVVFASSATQLATTAPGPVGFPLVANASSAPTFQAISLALVGSGAIGILAGGTGTGQVPLNFSIPYMASPTGYSYANPGGAGLVLTANASSAPTYQQVLTAGSGTLPVSLGGTGLTLFTPNQLFAGSGTTQMQQISGTPTWPLVANSGALPSFQQIALGGPAMSGTLGLTSGGTGVATSPAVGAIPYGSGVGYSYLAVGSSGTVLQSFGSGAQPGWVNATSGLAYTANQYGLIVSGSSSTQLNVIAPNSSTTMVLTSQGTGANPAWKAPNLVPPTLQTFSLTGSAVQFNTFTTSALSSQIVAGAQYTTSSSTFTVIYTAPTSATSVVVSGNGTPPGTGTLTNVAGTGPASITYSATSGSGTYQLPVAPSPLSIKIRLMGGGSGGSGSGTGPGNGAAGGATTFGNVFLNAGGAAATSGTIGAVGGTNTVSSGLYVVLNVSGSDGGGASDAVNANGAEGAVSFFGGAGKGGSGGAGTVGNAAKAGSGSGGGGAGAGATVNAGGAGGAGGYLEYLLINPSTSYTFSVGTGGAGGTLGTSGAAGGAGASGQIVIEEHYQ